MSSNITNTNPIRILSNPCELYILTQVGEDGKLVFVKGSEEITDLFFKEKELIRDGKKTKVLHAQLSDYGFGIIRGILDTERKERKWVIIFTTLTI